MHRVTRDSGQAEIGQAVRPDESATIRDGRQLGMVAAVTGSVSVALMVLVGIQGPSAGVAKFSPAPPWPPWFVHWHPSLELVSKLLWLALLLGAASLVTGLLALRHGWQPRTQRLIVGSFVAVSALLVLPPMGSADMLDYAVFGRIAVLEHSPYLMTPGNSEHRGTPSGRWRCWDTRINPPGMAQSPPGQRRLHRPSPMTRPRAASSG